MPSLREGYEIRDDDLGQGNNTSTTHTLYRPAYQNDGEVSRQSRDERPGSEQDSGDVDTLCCTIVSPHSHLLHPTNHQIWILTFFRPKISLNEAIDG